MVIRVHLRVLQAQGVHDPGIMETKMESLIATNGKSDIFGVFCAPFLKKGEIVLSAL